MGFRFFLYHAQPMEYIEALYAKLNLMHVEGLLRKLECYLVILLDFTNHQIY